MRYPLGVDTNRKLTSITESSADATEGYYKAQAGAYNYTQDGSMKSDANKNLTLTYNPLGLIAKANTNGAINDYLYTASGQKLSMSSGGTTYSYRGGIVYASTNTTDQIEQIATAEGRWLPKEALSSFKPDGTKSVAAKYGRYEFMMKDHLGNNRLAFRCIEIENATAITQAYPAIVTAEYQYDAWGLSIENQMMASSFTAQFGKFAATNRYKYNDKEYISDSKLYDYGARHYDPVVGRWWGVDPLAELNPELTSYRYGFNNPIRYTDFMGLWEKDKNGNNTTSDKEDIERIWTYLQFQSANGATTTMGEIDSFISFESSGGGDSYSLRNGSTLLFDGPTVKGNIENGSWKTSSVNWSGQDPNQGYFDRWRIGSTYAGFAKDGLNALNTAPEGMWFGKNEKVYSQSWGGNQYTGGRAASMAQTNKALKSVKMLGRGLVVADIAMNALELDYNGYSNRAFAKVGVAIAIGAISVATGGVGGIAIGIALSAIEAHGGFDKVYEQFSNDPRFSISNSDIQK